MRSEVYHSLLDIAEDSNDNVALKRIKRFTADNNIDSLCLTIKNYQLDKGLSKYIFETAKSPQKQAYQIKGPMGCGLEIQTKGTHVAFVAGTGILVFIDLVAHLILRLADPDIGKDLPDRLDLKNFTFKLFASFANEEEAIAMDLVNALKKMTMKLNMPHLF